LLLLVLELSSCRQDNICLIMLQAIVLRMECYAKLAVWVHGGVARSLIEDQCALCSDAWLAFLGMPLPEALLKRVLTLVTGPLLNKLTRPLLLSDFLSTSMDQGGYIGILALNGLFILVTEHGLEYPDFYKRLYTLLSPQVCADLSLTKALSCFRCAAETAAPSWTLSALCRFSQRGIATSSCSWLMSSWPPRWCQHTVWLPLSSALRAWL
jgi:hypothetical protein